MVDAGRDDVDAILGSTVEAEQLLAFLVGRGDDEIGAAHDLGLDARPEVDLVAQSDLRLHAIEGVKSGDEREVELVLQPVSDRARHPVVGVQQVVGAVGALDEIAGAAGEFGDEVGKLVAVDGYAWAGLDVQDTEAGFDHDDVGLLRDARHA